MTSFTRLLPVLFTALVIAVHLGLALWQNGGQFTYALDDPYIHLDLADQIARTGVYGVNEGEISAPSSSILWPLLLIPLHDTPFHPYLPLLLATLSALAAAATLSRVVRLLIGEEADEDFVALFTCMGAIILNLPGLALMGMEHATQVFLTLVSVLGVLQVLQGQQPRWWLWAVLFLAPLIRYENIITTTGALGILLWCGYGRAVLATLVLTLAALGSFSLYLVQLGLDPLPSSTLVKKLRWGNNFWAFWLKSMTPLLINHASLALTAGGVIFPVLALAKIRQFKSPRWAVLAALAGVTVLHAILGRISHIYVPRYEFYALAFVGPLLIWLVRDALSLPVFRRLGLALLAVISLPGVWCSLYDGHSAMHSIYLQQFQLSRLVKTYWQDKVAISDIGLIGYQNPYGILDLVGLANAEARRASWSGDPAWADKLVRRDHIKLIMVYREWFTPEERKNWTPVGELFCSTCTGAVGSPQVLFLTSEATEAAAISAKIRPWIAGLPAGAHYVEYNADHPAPPDTQYR